MDEIQYHHVPNGEGWKLALKRTVHRPTFNPSLPPVLIVPGYGMNAYIFGYHPNGPSFEAYMAGAGFEVWSVNLRTQGDSIREGGKTDYGFREAALVDLPAAVDSLLEKTETNHSKTNIIGTSLGGTFVYAYLASMGGDRLNGVITMGAPLRWTTIHPILRLAFGSPRVARHLKIRHTRKLAEAGLPMLRRVPWLLHLYLHPEIVDLSHPELLVKTVEDPNSQLNEEISRWILARDLILSGVNVTDSLNRIANPLLVMLANADGIVPAETAICAVDAFGSKDKSVVTVGTDRVRMAHADMFISRHSQEMVFKPLVQWMLRIQK